MSCREGDKPSDIFALKEGQRGQAMSLGFPISSYEVEIIKPPCPGPYKA